MLLGCCSEIKSGAMARVETGILFNVESYLLFCFTTILFTNSLLTYLFHRTELEESIVILM